MPFSLSTSSTDGFFFLTWFCDSNFSFPHVCSYSGHAGVDQSWGYACFFCAVIVTIVICSRKDPFLVVERRKGSLFVIYLRCPLENLVSVMMDGAHMGMESKKNHLVKIEPHHPVSY